MELKSGLGKLNESLMATGHVQQKQAELFGTYDSATGHVRIFSPFLATDWHR
jgi:hypothetical protein